MFLFIIYCFSLIVVLPTCLSGYCDTLPAHAITHQRHFNLRGSTALPRPHQDIYPVAAG